MAVSLAAPSNAIPGMTQAVVATVSNFGPATATGVTATYFLPAGLSYISSVSSQGSTSFSNGTVTASLGTLASGATATFTINVSATGGIVASHTINVDATENDPDRTNNLATAFSTVGDVDLVPFQPPGWSDKLVVAQAPGIFTDSPAFLPANTYYLAWAVMNNGTISTNAGFSVAIYVDGTLYTTGTASSTLRAGYYFYWNYSTVGLAPGTHTIRMVVDSGGTVPESDETNNEYTTTITVPASAKNSNARKT